MPPRPIESRFSRQMIAILTPFIFVYGVYTMLTGRVGRGPMPVEGPPAVLIGLVFSAFAVGMFLVGWRCRK